MFSINRNGSSRRKEIKIGEKIEFHKLTDKPIHLGDGKGKMDDIAPIVRNPNPPTEYTWKFNFKPDSDVRRTNGCFYSVAPYFRLGLFHVGYFE